MYLTAGEHDDLMLFPCGGDVVDPVGAIAVGKSDNLDTTLLELPHIQIEKFSSTGLVTEVKILTCRQRKFP